MKLLKYLKMSCQGCSFKDIGATGNLSSKYDWLSDLPDTSAVSDMVEVLFKATRKEFFRNTEKLSLQRGDWVVVAAAPGHDVGQVTLTGYLAEKQFRLKIKNPARYELLHIYRKASPLDLSRREEARKREMPVMIRARQIAKDLGLDMKIGDVEFRSDNGKAIFYYIAEGRVDFRELIKFYAREFGVKIEMKQIGARQEAGRVGGIGSCGRELCCSSWRTDFTSISSEALALQGLSPSAQKMAGACGKLKCCLLYELDVYMEAGQEFPEELLNLETSRGIAKPVKTDFLTKTVWYSLDLSGGEKIYQLPVSEVRRIIQENKKGIRPDLGTPDKPVNEPSFVLGSVPAEPSEEQPESRKKVVRKNKFFRNKKAGKMAGRV